MIDCIDVHRIVEIELTPIQERTLDKDLQREFYPPGYFIRKIILRDEAGDEMEINLYSNKEEGLIPILHD
jgi:hypothetical protein